MVILKCITEGLNFYQNKFRQTLYIVEVAQLKKMTCAVVHFSRDWARNFEKGPSSTQARDRFLEKGLENSDFYVVKNTGSSRLGIELL